MSENIHTLSFEDALNELEGIVRNLESGEAPLESSISSYERGIALKTHCETKLREAREKIEKITINQNGELSSVPLDTKE